MNIARKMLLACLQIPASAEETLKRRGKLEQCITAEGVCLHAESWISNLRMDRAAISIGRSSHILGQLLVFPHGGIIRIGETCYVGEHTRIWSAISVTIGSRVLISHGVNIHDTISHSLSAASRHDHLMDIFSSGHPSSLSDVASAPILIEDDAWLGFNSTILKGVTIGRGAVVGAASVVTKDVPAYAVVAGNPARRIGVSRP